ncbi:small Rab GTP binding protein [Trypanosoma conorhini]|uniref:Small Rab GTP binding protein n=1 Tax=Trypanosoma conorhini TaxID=83891 RepID=A0A3R7M8Y5_9TRYP|nr:small Rab GTP binding protein [Trypanosoma conorhini]RNF01577.1 small Rab GTP binding protein [Trypanosoma conorhini]
MTSVAAATAAKKYKVVLLGDSGVGKSSLVQRLAKDEWNENQNSTVGASFFRYSCPVDDATVNFDIWDTAGQERYKSLASMYYRGAAAALVVYELPLYETFERAKYWVRELAANSPETFITLVGNKSDLADRRSVSAEEAAAYAREMGLMFGEASAKDGAGVREVFERVARQLVAANSENIVRDGGVVGGRQPSAKSGRTGCCS